MTEAERQQKIALALRRISSELFAFVGSTKGAECDEMRRWVRQLSTLAGEFEQGRYLPEKCSAEVGDDPGGSAAPVPD